VSSVVDEEKIRAALNQEVATVELPDAVWVKVSAARPDRPGLWSRLRMGRVVEVLAVGALLVGLLGVAVVRGNLAGNDPTRKQGVASPSPRKEWIGIVAVNQLPKGSVVDLVNKSLTPMPNSSVKVLELGIRKTTNQAGEVDLALPLGQSKGFGPDEGVYTFDVTSPQAKYHTIIRSRLTTGSLRLEVPYNFERDVFFDYSTKDPERFTIAVTVKTLPEASAVGGKALAGATVKIEEKPDLVMTTDQNGKAIFSLPEGFYTFDVSTVDTPFHTKERRGVFRNREMQFVIGYDANKDVFRD
jgi:hypothetical protein